MHGGASCQRQGPGQGTELVVRLPLLGVTSTSFGVPTGRSGRRSRPAAAILVADDNSDAVEALALQLQLAGHDVRTANDGDWKRSRSPASFAPQVVLLDLGMPRMDGYETARQIRLRVVGQERHARGADRLGGQQDRQRTSAAGFDVHLVKPVTESISFTRSRRPAPVSRRPLGPPSSNSRNRGRPRPITFFGFD